MQLTPKQMAEAVTEMRAIIAEHDPIKVGFIDVSIGDKVTDDQLATFQARIMGAVTQDPTP
jgi:hypothetical protein